jgi:hypothetical protein
MQPQCQYPEHPDASFAVGDDRFETPNTPAAGSCHELTDAPNRVQIAAGILGSKSLVVVVVAIDHHLGPTLVEGTE